MSYAFYERLSAMDAVFLDIESTSAPMHIGSVGIFDAAPLTTKAGGLDIDRILAFCEAALSKNPRFRQKLAYVPGLGTPVWIDDNSFNLGYHIRHARLPIPGDERQLKRLAGRIMSQQLDRGKPLWEFWYVEGVEGGRCAVIAKIHHCLADGMSGVDMLSKLMGPNPNFTLKADHKWIPRPAPAATRLLVDELTRRAQAPLNLLRSGTANAAGRGGVRDILLGVSETLSSSMSPASETPFDVDLGPHRRFDWARFDLEQVRCVKDHLGGKVNDVCLAVVAGALRQFLGNRGLRVDNLSFRAAVPVSVRAESERSALGNRVSMLMVALPLGEADPVERFRLISENTTSLKRGHLINGTDSLVRLIDAVSPGLSGTIARLGLQAHTANLVVTNVPGPPEPVYFMGARLLESYPVVPLVNNMGLGIALFSYAGGLHWGFNADWDAFPDLHELVTTVQREFDVLCSAATKSAATKETRPQPTRRRTRAAAKRPRASARGR